MNSQKFLKTKYKIENVSTELYELLPVNDLLIVISNDNPNTVSLFTQPSGFNITYTGANLPGGVAGEGGLTQGEDLGDMLINAVTSTPGTNAKVAIVEPEQYTQAVTSFVTSGGNWSYPGVPQATDAEFIKSAAGQAAEKKKAEEAAVLEGNQEEAILAAKAELLAAQQS